MIQQALKLYTKRYGLVEPTQADRLSRVMSVVQAVPVLPQRAYILATIGYETQHFWMSTTPPTTKFGVRGLIPIKGRDKYARFGKALGLKLSTAPELLDDIETAARAATVGMMQGLFTGRQLGEFVDSAQAQFVEARFVVNTEAHPREAKQVSRELGHWLEITEALGAV